MKTVSLDDGKYKFDIGENGLMETALRHDEHWAAGFEMRFQKVFMSALWRIIELQEENERLKKCQALNCKKGRFSDRPV